MSFFVTIVLLLFTNCPGVPVALRHLRPVMPTDIIASPEIYNIQPTVTLEDRVKVFIST